MARVTIHDVAKRAGFSHTTVSWVIHDDPRITPDTKKKVLAAISELGYFPNLSARSLVSGKTGIIAIVATFFSTIFELEIMQGVEDGLENKNDDTFIQLYSTRGSRERKNEIFDQILKGHKADAVICLSLKPEKHITEQFNLLRIPLVLVEEKMRGAISIKTENVLGSRLAVNHLTSMGRSRIGLACGSIGGEESGLSPKERLEGYRRGLSEAGIPFHSGLVIETDDYNIEGGRKVLRRYIKSGSVPEAIFCAAGDLVALGILAEAKDNGISIPEELSVIGFDDTFVAPLATPALTTVRQPLKDMGRIALKLALDAIDGKPVQDKIFQPKLIVRGTA